MKEEFSREMEKKEKITVDMKEELDQGIAAMKEEFIKQVDKGEQMTEKLAEQRKVCCNISMTLKIVNFGTQPINS